MIKLLLVTNIIATSLSTNVYTPKGTSVNVI